MTAEFREAVQALLNELNRESASGLISRRALILIDRVNQLMDGERDDPVEPDHVALQPL